MLDSTALRFALRLGTLLVAALVVLTGLAGPDDVSRNLAPWVFYMVFWVGLVPASLLLGPVWRVLNPLRLLQARDRRGAADLPRPRSARHPRRRRLLAGRGLALAVPLGPQAEHDSSPSTASRP